MVFSDLRLMLLDCYQFIIHVPLMLWRAGLKVFLNFLGLISPKLGERELASQHLWFDPQQLQASISAEK